MPSRRLASFAPLAALLAVPLLLIGADAQAQTPENALTCPVLPTLLQRYVQSHVSIHSIDAALDDRAADLWADRLDPTHALLTQPEHDKLKAQLRQLIRNARSLKCDDFATLRAQQLQWYKDNEAFARKLLSDDKLTLDKSITLQVEADKRTRPKTPAERDELRRKLIHFQLANYIKDGVEMKDARQKLIHRYELNTRRVAEISEPDLFAEFLNTFANALDPHSTYFSPDQLADFNISMQLALEGIGAVLSSRDGYTVVQEVVPGGAAARQGGLRPEDKIIAVSQGPEGEPVDVIDMDLGDVVKMIRGKKGSQVKLTVLRQSERTERLEFLITRDKIDLQEQAAKLRFETVERGGRKLKLAIIDLPSFYGGQREEDARDCTEDMRKLLADVRREKADGLLLDLSSNGGGLLQAAVEISGLFIASGPIVGVQSPESTPDILRDLNPDIAYSGPLIVLTSRVSASASEILSGALQDYKRAVIVGDDQTFGKGSVQNIVPLPPGFGALKVTTAMFFRPDGASTQANGVKSDIVLPSFLSSQDIGERFEPWALTHRAITPFPGAQVNAADPERAFKPIQPDTLKKLAAASAKRVARSREFKEIEESIQKSKKNEGAVRIADLFDEKTAKTAETTPDKKKDEPTPQEREAIEILADLVVAK